MLLGCIADDLTGATDLALMLVRGGMRTLQVIGVPDPAAPLPEADAVVVALKSRTVAAAEAVKQSLAAAAALRAGGARQLFFKYCSTFDSTDAGNIGPVTEALLEYCGGDLTIACPAFPATGRTLYRGYLFVGDVLLSESPLRDHPLTPMRDPNLVRVLQRQTALPVGLLGYETVVRGTAAIRAGFDQARRDARRVLIVDALSDEHLHAIGAACDELALVTGGSGVAMGLPANFRRAGLFEPAEPASGFAAPGGAGAILAGSCSAATRDQVQQAIAAGIPACQLDPLQLAVSAAALQGVECWAREQLSAERPLLLYSTADPSVGRRCAERARARARRRPGRTRDGGARARLWWRPACAGWWSPAARPRVPWSRRWAAKVLQIGQRSTPGCPGRWR